MDIFVKGCAAVLLTVILGLSLSKGWKEAGILLTICVVCMVFAAALHYLKPVIAMIRNIQKETGLDGDLLNALLKIVGIGLTAEIAELICNDAGNAGLGKVVGLLGTSVILWLCVPLVTQLLDLIRKILGGI